MTNPPQAIMSWERRGMDSTRSFFPQNFAWPVLKITFFPLALKPEGLATYLFYTILLLLIRRKKLYKISIWLKPRVHELKGKKMICEKRTQNLENWKCLSARKKWLRINVNRYRPEIFTKCLCTNVRYVHQFSGVYYNICGVRGSSYSGHFYRRRLY